MKPSTFTKICAAALLAASVGPWNVAALPIETAAAPDMQDAGTSRVIDQLSHSFAESDAMRQLRDALDEAVNGEHSPFIVRLSEAIKPEESEPAKFKEVLTNFAHRFKADVAGFFDKLQSLFNFSDMKTKENQQKFTDLLINAFHEYMDNMHKKAVDAPEKKDAAATRLVARAVEQLPPLALADTITIGAGNGVGSSSSSSSSGSVTAELAAKPEAQENHFIEMGTVIGQMLERVVTGKAQEPLDVLFLRLLKQVIVTLETRAPSVEMTNKSIMDEALETVKKATDAALITLQQSNAGRVLEATDGVVTAAAAAGVDMPMQEQQQQQPQQQQQSSTVDYREFDTTSVPDTAVLTESKMTFIPISTMLDDASGRS
ncbi:hypothetical protein SYNPS1DRAFT_23072 [Syncephalis pseudoplumigaleata]|uniref:Uncharacterized protein n=1 Tax=Syncephalis pseudoplumigaleata TaxID=1712513 RepID=A0A4P9YY91_9FUNG|nr:hypothetical protein SYNPS1DRAFT_23072 [Syncephalis pseudoplumigaleata]|eukprot:RKP24885.1 hypothetical protein SYNPS1DRAFT_23072 [Syncephalis pseudoplumigaleata]